MIVWPGLLGKIAHIFTNPCGVNTVRALTQKTEL